MPNLYSLTLRQFGRLTCLLLLSGNLTARPHDPVMLKSRSAALAPISYSVQADPFPQVSSGARRIFFDADADGDMDLLYQTSTVNGTGIALKLNNGSGDFSTTHTATLSGGTGTFSTGPLNGIGFTGFSSVASPFMLAVDYDKDGDTDLYESVSGGTGRMLRNNGNSTFTVLADPFPQVASGARRIFFDADADGDIDLLYQTSNASGNGIALKLNNGSGDFSTTHTATLSGGTGTFSSGPLNGIGFTVVSSFTLPILLVVDYDKDGDTDLYESVSGGAGRLIRNNGNSTFAVLADPFPQVSSGARRIFFDADADGDMDLLYQDSNAGGTGIALKLNNGSGDFSTTHTATHSGTTGTFSSGPLNGISFTSFSSVGSPFMLAVDYDKDGDTDLYESVSAGTGRIIQQALNPPVVSSTIPVTNATLIGTSTNLTITFDRSLVKGTGSIQIIRTSDNSVVETIAVSSGLVTGSGTTWVVDPASTLAVTTTYAVRVASGTFVDTDGRIFTGILNNTTFKFTTGASALPVELIYFQANWSPTGVNTEWATASEQQASHFLVERSADLISFSEVGQRQAVGQPRQERIVYRLIDEKPLSGTSYYRLTQVDRDGQAHAYRPVSVLNEASGSVYPNPTDGQVFFVRTEAGEVANWLLINGRGQQVKFSASRDSEGVWRIRPVDVLQAGVYIFHQNGVLRHKIVVP
ncbi:MAG: T9SS type A sorting domain-containing protein [Cytophagaceae bacterium]|nr:MAG: T9SS type A sorting domain-containing protein [Cytophagaceae bacterium]